MHDEQLRGRELGQTSNEKDVQSFYEDAPYPGIHDALKDPTKMLDEAAILLGHPPDKTINYLEAGCGTGHYLVGVAKQNPHWHCVGIDLSSASIDVCKQLNQNHNCTVELHKNSYLDDLPFPEGYFDIIGAHGTIHHCDDPVAALRNLTRYLKEDGIVSMHLYGARLDRGKFDLKEAISLFQPDLSNYSERFSVYQAITQHQKKSEWLRSLLRVSLLDVFRWLRKALRNANRKMKGISWSPPWTDMYEVPSNAWKDHFCHPCERAYEVPDVRGLVRAAGLEAISMHAQGRVDLKLVPPELRNQFEKLGHWDQWRLIELIGPEDLARSFVMFLRKSSVP